jgi:anti-sigma factor RsiW
MRCKSFLEDYSEFRDGLLSPERTADLEAHLGSCSHCARYHRIMRTGLQLLATIPAAETSEDFMPRLRHRLYNIDDGILHTSRGRFGGSAALVGVAAVGLLALFWLPFAASVPMELELPAVAVQAPAAVASRVPELFRQGPFVSSLLEERQSQLDGDHVQWPPRSHIHPTAILFASNRGPEPATHSR